MAQKRRVFFTELQDQFASVRGVEHVLQQRGDLGEVPLPRLQLRHRRVRVEPPALPEHRGGLRPKLRQPVELRLADLGGGPHWGLHDHLARRRGARRGQRGAPVDIDRRHEGSGGGCSGLLVGTGERWAGGGCRCECHHADQPRSSEHHVTTVMARFSAAGAKAQYDNMIDGHTIDIHFCHR
jgi:hypothetical protein